MSKLSQTLAGLDPKKRALLAALMKEGGAPASRAVILPVARTTDSFPLSFAQERLWFLDRLWPGDISYGLPTALRLTGPLDPEALRRALAEIVRRHETLRTHFVEREGRPFQVISPASQAEETRIPWVDLTALPADRRDGEAARLADLHVILTFDLERGPLLAVTLVRLGDESHSLLFNMHHIISDGWSMRVLIQEVAALYGAIARGATSAVSAGDVLPRLTLQYADYAAWQREWLQGEVLERQLGYWRQQLAGAPPSLDLPADRPRPAVPTFRGSQHGLVIEPAVRAGLAALGRQTGATLFMTLLAVFFTLLHRLTGRLDLVVGTPIAGRQNADLEKLIGFFVNSLVLRCDASGDPAFSELLGRVQRGALGAFDHQDLPFEKLVEDLQPERSLGHQPLFQVMFALQNVPKGKSELSGGLQLRIQDGRNPTAKFDLSLIFNESPDELLGMIDYSADLFDSTTAARLLAGYGCLLQGAAADPGARLGELPLLPAVERHQLLSEWSAPADTSEDIAGCIHERIAQRAAAIPGAVAVVDGVDGGDGGDGGDGAGGGFELTYAELRRRSSGLAQALRRLGVKPDDRVALAIERSADAIVAMLGVLEAGGAYVPLDPAHPGERLAGMVEDSGASILLVRSQPAPVWAPPGLRTFALDAFDGLDGFEEATLPALAVSPRQAAYVLYTSGSTGRPKGVVVEHRSLAAYALEAAAAYGISEGERCLQFAALSFDTAAEEIYPCLAAGGTLVLRSDGMLDSPRRFLAELERLGIGFVDLPTAYWHELAASFAEGETAETAEITALPPTVRIVVIGGEKALSDRLALWWEIPGAGRVRLINTYGPTETTIVATRAELMPGRPLEAPIGRPIPGARAYVVDPQGRLLPSAADGELWIGGSGLARGYLGRPDLTAASFVPDPFGGPGDGRGERLYRTGDRVRRRHDGALEFLGRIDAQVKVRGFRVELGEIASVLARHPALRSAAVVVQGEVGGAPRLVACAVAADPGQAPSAAELRRFLAAALPEYMVPAAFAFLPELPLTPHGKVDHRALERRALESGAGAERELAAASAGLRTPAEKALAGIWAELLGLKRVGAQDNFFELGGHSLLAARLVSRVRSIFGVELALRSIFEEPTVAALAARIAQLRIEGAKLTLPPLAPVPRPAGPSGEPELPLSFAQQRLWFLDRLAPGAAYNIPAALRLRGPLDVRALEGALSEVSARHEVLRTTFHYSETGAGAIQRIALPRPFPLPRIDLGSLGEAAGAEALRLAAEEALRPFDLEKGPVIRGLLLRLGAEDHGVLLTMHHIASDGWSIEVLTGEMVALYAAFSEGRPSPLAPLPVQYGDYAVWQRGWLTAEVLESQLRFWRQALAGAPAVLELPADRPRPALPSGRGGVRAAGLPEGLGEALAALGRREEASLFMVFLAAWKALLWRLTGQSDLPVGTVVAGRDRLEIEPLIGFFVNTLVLRTDLGAESSEGPSFLEAVARERAVALAAFAHQDVPFERLVEELSPSRSQAYAPLFQVVLSFETDTAMGAPAGSSPMGSRLAVEPLGIAGAASEERAAKFDLTLTLTETAAGLAAALEFNRDLFDASTAQRLLGGFLHLLAGAAAAPAQRLGELPLLSASERHQLLAEWNDSLRPYPADRCLHELFAEQAARTPQAPALAFAGTSMTYGELAERAGRLARHLRALGVGPEVRVGLCAERSPALIVGMLAILEAGGAYVPLDPGYPRERLALLLEDSRPAVLLAQDEPLGRLPESPAVRVSLDADPASSASLGAPPAAPANAAHVLYTSGSTGRPKGVVISHRSVVRLVRNAGYLQIGPSDRVGQASSPGFDAATFEVWGALLNGACLVGLDRQVLLSSQALAARLIEERITVLLLTAALFHQVAREVPDAFAPLRCALLGGEAADPHRLREVLEAAPPGRLLNVYGPTECTTIATWHHVERVAAQAAAVPIGRPIGNTGAWVLDGGLRAMPIGAEGELFLGGDGVARGYLGRPDLTAERFLPDAWSGEPGARAYRTGDRVRARADGVLEFLGRTDLQVKLRGFRIEPGEIETVIGLHPQVAQAAVLLREDRPGDRRLVAYVAPEVPEGLRSFLAERLPEPMVPSAFVPVGALPLTPNGKIDRRALPAPEAALPRNGFLAPRGPVEEVLAGIWGEVLGVEKVGANDNFFELSGHSLLATQVTYRVRKAFGVDLPLRRLFEGATVAELAREIEAAAKGTAAAGLPPLEARRGARAQRSAASFFQEWAWQVQGGPVGSQFNLPIGFRVGGPLDLAALRGAFAGVVRRHESLRFRFRETGEGLFVETDAADSPGLAPLPLVDLSALREDRREAAAEILAAEEAGRSFDLSRDPVVSAMALRLGERDHVVLFNMHHIVSDGWSIEVFQGELIASYRALVRGEEPRLPVLPIQFSDFADWQRRALTGEALAGQLAYWKRRLAGYPPSLQLPTRLPRPERVGTRSVASGLLLTGGQEQELRTLARATGSSLSMLLLTAFMGVLHRYSGREDLVTGSIFSGRNRPELTGMIGLFINTVMLRIDYSGSPSFRESVLRVRETVLEAYAHGDLPFPKILAELVPGRRLERLELSRTSFNMLSFPAAGPQSDSLGSDLDLRGLNLGEAPARYDLTFEGRELPDAVSCVLVGAAELFSQEDITGIRDDFETLLSRALADPDAPFDRLLPAPCFSAEAGITGPVV